jgi:hypothetical protein
MSFDYYPGKFTKKCDDFSVSVETAVKDRKMALDSWVNPALNILIAVGQKHPVKLYYFVILVVNPSPNVEYCHSGE